MQLKLVSLRASSAQAALSPSCHCSRRAALCGHGSVGTGRVQEWRRHGNGDFFVLLGLSSGGFCKGLLGTSAQVKWSNQNGSWLAASLADGPAGAARGAGLCPWHVYRGQEPHAGKPSGRSAGVTPMCQDPAGPAAPSLPVPAQDPVRPHRRARGQQTGYKCESPSLFPTLRSARGLTAGPPASHGDPTAGLPAAGLSGFPAKAPQRRISPSTRSDSTGTCQVTHTELYHGFTPGRAVMQTRVSQCCVRPFPGLWGEQRVCMPLFVLTLVFTCT